MLGTQSCKITLSFQKFFSKSLHRIAIIRNYSGLQYESLEESYQQTTVELDSKNPERHPLSLTGYGTGLFKFAHITINGPIAIADKAVFKWNVTNPSNITAASFALFYLIHPKIDTVVVGTGNTLVRLHPDVIAEVGKRGVKLEIQDTKNACGTYNLLKRDRPRDIGAALIPITQIKGSKPKFLPRSKPTMLK